tara:strand:+ start:18275 stop:18514 length:240 start_codon:yes stop_codon:yes gene_type:complete
MNQTAKITAQSLRQIICIVSQDGVANNAASQFRTASNLQDVSRQRIENAIKDTHSDESKYWDADLFLEMHQVCRTGRSF